MSKLSMAIAALAMVVCGATCPVTAAEKINVLLITGDDVGVHKWQEVAPATKELLSAAGKFTVTVSEQIGVLDDAEGLKKYDLIYFALYNTKTPPPSAAGQQNLLAFVKGGKGFAVAHLASASYKDWPEFRQLCGRYWVMGQSGHGPRAPFKVRISDKDHPITKGLADFEMDDELYAKLQGDGPIHVLAESDSAWSKKTEPMVFTAAYGQGRVFHHTFGHDTKALDNPACRKLIQRGCEWAATGAVK